MPLAAVTLVALLGVGARADIVYLKNGNSYDGTVVSRTDKEVIINVRGEHVKIPIRDVLHVKIEKPAPEGPEKQEPKEPEREGAQTQIIAEVPTGGRQFLPKDATRPETVIFALMRNLATTSPGPDAYRIRKEIERWRIAAHDEKRKIGLRWSLPKDFAAHRAAFTDVLKEAQALARQARGHGRRISSHQTKKRKEWAAAMSKLREAALKWPEALLRDFLSGLAALEAEEYDVAAGKLRACCDAAPRVAGFRQAHSAALLELKQHVQAVAELTQVLRLVPGSRDAAVALQEAMKKTPGGLTKDPAFVKAQQLLKEYERPSAKHYSSRAKTWLMPGRQWYVSEHELLPTPPYDRLVFRQGVAVAIDEQTVIVDPEVLKDAEEIFIRLDSETTVGATRRRLSYRGAEREDEPLAFVRVDGVEFTPVKFDKDFRPRTNHAVVFYGLSIYEEMGRGVRQVATTVTSAGADGTLKLAEGPVAGEAAGPVVTGDGRLVTFLTGKTNIKADDGGKAAAISPAEIADLVERASKGSSHFSTYGRVRRKASAKALRAKGHVFVVYATAVEKLN